MDVETYQRLVLTARMVAVTHPQNLVRFAEASSLVTGENDVSVTNEKSKSEERRKFMMHLINWFWQLLAGCPANASVGTLGRNGLNVEATVQALVEIFHAFTSFEVETVPFAAQLYSQFLMADNVQVSFAAKQALIRVLRPRVRRRRVFAPTPPRCPSPDPNRAQATTSQPSAEESYQDESRSEAEENDLNIGPGGIPLGGIAGNFDALIPAVLGGAGGANAGPVLELPGEIDDEAMVELAIALSLQEQGEGGADIENLHQGLQGLHQQLANLGPALQGFPALQVMIWLWQFTYSITVEY
jgi:E3 ubiquitin-protein ligase UBR4